MAATILLKRAAGKQHLTSFQEGVDDAVLSSLIRTSAGAATLYNDAFTTSVTIGGSAQTTGALFGGAAMTALDIGLGMGAGDNVNIGGAGSTTTIGGDLVVSGTTTSVDSEVVNIADNHLYLNAGYTPAVAQTGGLVVNYLPTATADTSTTGGFASTTTVNTVGAATFPVGALIQFSSAANPANNGLYEVLTHAANLLTIASSPSDDFTQNAFVVDAGDVTAVITQVTVSVLRSGVDGIWETASGSTAGLTFVDLGAAAGNSLQAAYVQGNTISMTDAEGDFSVTVGSGSPAIILEAADVSRLQVTGASLTLSTVTSGALAISGAGVVDVDAATALSLNSSGGAINVGDDAVAQPINVGTGAAARTVTIGNASGASSVVINAGTGNIDIGTGAQARTTNIATGAASQSVTIGSLTTTSSLLLQAGATGSITLDANNMTTPLPFNGTTAGDTGNQDLSSNFTATTMMGALNELKETASASDSVVESYVTTGRAIGEPVFIDGDNSANSATDATVLATAEGFAGLVLTVGTPGTVVTHGSAVAQFDGGLTGGTYPVAGDPVYLSETLGRVTTVAPSGTPNSGIIVFQIGVMKDASTLTVTTTVDGDLGEILLQPMQLIEL